jgi:hypothetical protein
MKKLTLFLAIIVIIAGIPIMHWCYGQTGRGSVGKGSETDSYYGLRELESFVTFLQQTKVTNALQRFNDYSHARMASESSARLGLTLHMLDALRNGRTNEAVRLLDLQMRGDVVTFAAAYQELPASVRSKAGLTAFTEARDYCRRYPDATGTPETSAAIMQAFAILDGKAEH